MEDDKMLKTMALTVRETFVKYLRGLDLVDTMVNSALELDALNYKLGISFKGRTCGDNSELYAAYHAAIISLALKSGLIAANDPRTSLKEDIERVRKFVDYSKSWL